MYTIDRFEGNYAVIEDSNQQIIKVEKSIIPKEAKEGDCLRKKANVYVIDIEATKQRTEKVRGLMSELFE